jgi:hypothetical protein
MEFAGLSGVNRVLVDALASSASSAGATINPFRSDRRTGADTTGRYGEGLSTRRPHPSAPSNWALQDTGCEAASERTR